MEKRKNSISDRQVISTEVDSLPDFRGLPGGLEDGEFTDGTVGGGTGGNPSNPSDPGSGEEGGGGEPEEFYGPPPSDFQVKQQNLRFDREGNQIWDVVISWEEPPGAQEYDVRYYKKGEGD